MDWIPKEWAAKKRCLKFWMAVLGIDSERLLKQVVLEAMELGTTVEWMRNLQSSLEECQWKKTKGFVENGDGAVAVYGGQSNKVGKVI